MIRSVRSCDPGAAADVAPGRPDDGGAGAHVATSTDKRAARTVNLMGYSYLA
jgi:hypothetical protein